jgi:RNA polymerase sigma factor (sigma-70 family)
MDERAAADRLKRGDVGGLEMLVDRYHTRATRAAYLVVRDAALAEDVAQGAFVRAFERIGGFDAGRPFGPWFMKLVLNEAITVARKRERLASREVRGAEEILTRLAARPGRFRRLGAGPRALRRAARSRIPRTRRGGHGHPREGPDRSWRRRPYHPRPGGRRHGVRHRGT